MAHKRLSRLNSWLALTWPVNWSVTPCAVLPSILPVRDTGASNTSSVWHPKHLCNAKHVFATLQLGVHSLDTCDTSDSCSTPVVHHRNFLSFKSGVYVMLFHMHLCRNMTTGWAQRFRPRLTFNAVYKFECVINFFSFFFFNTKSSSLSFKDDPHNMTSFKRSRHVNLSRSKCKNNIQDSQSWVNV